MRLHTLLARLLPLSLAIGLCLAAPAYAGGGNSQGDNNHGNEDGGGPGPSIPEPSGWLAMGVGLVVVGSYARSHFRPQR